MMPSPPTPFWYRLNGTSMAPALQPDDEVWLVPLTRPPLPGDVVLAHMAPGRWVLHRVWRVRGGQIQLRGDACVRADAPVDGRQVLWRALRHRHNGQEGDIAPAHPSLRLRWRRVLAQLRDVRTRLRARHPAGAA